MTDEDKDKDGSDPGYDELFDETLGPREEDVHKKGKSEPENSGGAKKPEGASEGSGPWQNQDDIEKIKKLCDEVNAANKKLAEVNNKLWRLEVDNANKTEIIRVLSEAKSRQDKQLSCFQRISPWLIYLLEQIRKYSLELQKRNLRSQTENGELAKDRVEALTLANYERDKRVTIRAVWGLVYFIFGAAFASLLFWFFAIYKI